MKKWSLHITACIVNMIAAGSIFFTILSFFFSERIRFQDRDILPLAIFTTAFLIYLTADIYGLKLLFRYKHSSTIPDKRNIAAPVILTFHFVAQSGTTFGVYTILSELLRPGRRLFHLQKIELFLDIMLLCVFISGIISFITTIQLLKAIKQEKNTLVQEIESIGAAN